MKYIYKITNLLNGKIYVGKRSYNGNYQDDTYMGSGKFLWRSYKKNLGNDCNHDTVFNSGIYKKELLQVCEDDNELNAQEIYWIKYLDSTNPNIGYNISTGGTGNWSQCHTTEVVKRRVMTQMSNGSFDKFKECSLTKEARLKAESTKKLNGAHKRSSDRMKAINNDESIKLKRLNSIIESGKLDKFIKSGNSPSARRKSTEKYYFVDKNNTLHLMDRTNAKRYHPDWVQLVSESLADDSIKLKYITDHNIYD